jgi:membrane protein YqaA with SNARE-associated domain
MLRQVYNWVAGWSHRRYSIWTLFGLTFAEPCFFPMLLDVLLIALYVENQLRLFCSQSIYRIGSVLGGIGDYGIGLFAFEAIGKLIISKAGSKNTWTGWLAVS